MKVELSVEAEGQIDAIDAWWRANRLSAPGLFTDELDQALSDLAATPSLGTIYRGGSQALRRLLLPSTIARITRGLWAIGPIALPAGSPL